MICKYLFLFGRLPFCCVGDFFCCVQLKIEVPWVSGNLLPSPTDTAPIREKTKLLLNHLSFISYRKVSSIIMLRDHHYTRVCGPSLAVTSHSRSSGLIHLRTESLHLFTNLSVPLPIILFCFCEFNFASSPNFTTFYSWCSQVSLHLLYLNGTNTI